MFLFLVVDGFGFLFFCVFWLWVVGVFLGLVLFLVVGVVFLCWFFCVEWLALVLVISCHLKNGIREICRQVIKERLQSSEKRV